MGRPGSSRGADYLKDLKIIMDNLEKEIKLIKGGTIQGMIRSAAMIREETEKGSVKTPVDYGNLRASWFTVTQNAIPVGKGSAGFNGPKGDKVASEHRTVIGEKQGELKTEKSPAIFFGYSAFYAGFIHEMLNVKNWTRKGSGTQWFQKAIVKKSPEILSTIQKYAKIRK
jgi:hypothetical protein